MVSNDLILLRKLERKDVDMMENWGKHEETAMQHYNFPSFTTYEKDIWYRVKAKSLFKRCYAVIKQEDESLIGYISLRNYNVLNRSAEIGIVLDPSNVNKGFGSEALSLFVNHMLKFPLLKVLKLHVALYNTRALKCYKNVGFNIRYKVFREFEDQSMGYIIREEIIKEHEDFKVVKNKLYTQYYLMDIDKQGISTKKSNLC